MSFTELEYLFPSFYKKKIIATVECTLGHEQQEPQILLNSHYKSKQADEVLKEHSLEPAEARKEII